MFTLKTNINDTNDLRDFISHKCLIKQGSILLSSGLRSDTFFDIKTAILDWEASSLINSLMYKQLVRLSVKNICGVEAGGWLLASQLCIYARINYKLNVSIVRNKRKDHGLKKIMEGKISYDDRTMVLVDDVLTTGKTIVKAAGIVDDCGFKVENVLVVFYRLDVGRELLKQHGLDVISLCGMDDVKR